MTDRYKGFIVHLDKDIREDDCEEIITALRMVKRVREVEPLISTLDDAIAYERGKAEALQGVAQYLHEQLEKQIRGEEK